MALQIPTYKEQIAPQQQPNLAVPAAPVPPPAAFGTDQAQATERLGRTMEGVGMDLADHIAERQRQQQRLQVIDADTKFRQDLQNVMFDEGTVEKPDPSDPEKTVTMPAGVFNRQLGQAHGAVQDFDQAFDNLKDKYLSQFSNPMQQKEMSQLMDENYTHHRQLVIHHEANQLRENDKNILEGNLKQMVNDAGNLPDPQTWIAQLRQGEMRQFTGMKDAGYDDGSIGVANDKFATDMAVSAITPQISSDPAKAYAYLDAIKDELIPTTYAKLHKMIEVQSKQMGVIDKQVKDTRYKDNARQAMLDMFSHKLTLSELQRRYRNDDIDLGFYNSMERKLITPEYANLSSFATSDPKKFADIRQGILDGTLSPQEVQQRVLDGSSDGSINDEDGAYFMNLLKDQPPTPRDKDISAQGKSVEDFANRYFAQSWGDVVPVPGADKVKRNEKQSQDDAKAAVADFYRRVDQENAQGPRIAEIAHEVINQNVQKRYPEISRLSDIPHIVVGIDGKVKRLLAPGEVTKLKGQYKITRNAGGGKDMLEVPTTEKKAPEKPE